MLEKQFLFIFFNTCINWDISKNIALKTFKLTYPVYCKEIHPLRIL